jgi:hypothetical protein
MLSLARAQFYQMVAKFESATRSKGNGIALG